jgi:hypothetical protein
MEVLPPASTAKQLQEWFTVPMYSIPLESQRLHRVTLSLCVSVGTSSSDGDAGPHIKLQTY